MKECQLVCYSVDLQYSPVIKVQKPGSKKNIKWISPGLQCQTLDRAIENHNSTTPLVQDAIWETVEDCFVGSLLFILFSIH
jgi:hypothetical protein